VRIGNNGQPHETKDLQNVECRPPPNLDISVAEKVELAQRSAFMHQLWGWITANSGAITVVAAFVAALATLAFFVATIKIFRETKRSADAAAEVARLATELHRPFMALESVILRNAIEPKQTNWRQDCTWTVDWSIANLGTLPANHVHASLELRTPETLKLDEGPKDIEVYPQSQPITRTTQLLVNPEDVEKGTIQVSANVTIDYASSIGTRYRHTAEAHFNNAQRTFAVSQSKTEILERKETTTEQNPILTV
jgi:hypothetical protein